MFYQQYKYNLINYKNMKGDKNDYNSLDFENDVTLDNKNNITINPNVKMEQIANNLNKNQQNRESLDSGSTSAASSNGDQKGFIIYFYAK